MPISLISKHDLAIKRTAKGCNYFYVCSVAIVVTYTQLLLFYVKSNSIVKRNEFQHFLSKNVT